MSMIEMMTMISNTDDTVFFLWQSLKIISISGSDNVLKKFIRAIKDNQENPGSKSCPNYSTVSNVMIPSTESGIVIPSGICGLPDI